MSQLREFVGKGWHDWPIAGDTEDISLASSPSHSDLASGDITPSSSRASSPPPHLFPKDDVTKLPRHDMHMFGQCPVQDEFLVAVCDSCGIVVKLEAFASHIKLRHGLPLRFASTATPSSASSTTSAATRSGRGGPNKSFKPSSVDLHKISSKLKNDGSKKSSSGSSSTGSSCPPPSRSKTPTPDKELVTISILPPASTTSTSEVLSLHDDSMMDIDDHISNSSGMANNNNNNSKDNLDVKSSADSTQFLSKYGDDDDDMDTNSNSTSNVISIPDTDPLPHNMSGDLMAMVSEVVRPMEIDNQSSPVIKLQDPSSATLVLASSLNTQPISGNGSTAFASRPQVPAAIVVQSPSSGVKALLPNTPESFNKSLIKSSPGKKGSSGNRSDRKPLREYHPDKHCGVWDNEGSRNCTRALTCKSHSVLLKRKVEGRSKPFDELLLAHKKAQAALAAATAAGTSPSISTPLTPVSVSPTVVTLPTTPVAPSSIIHTVQLNGGARPGTLTVSKPPPHILFPQTPVQPSLTLQPQQSVQQQQQSFHFVAKDLEDSLHYTTDHPKPLALHTFGGRRIGGLLFSDRSKLLTRKLVRVAITTSVPGMGGTRTSGVAGFHRIGPRVTLFQGDTPTPLAIVNGLKRSKDQPTFLLNYSLGGGKRTVVGGGIGTTSIGTSPVAPTVNLSTLQPGASVVIPESFKTDIQDFKGGIKFELGSKIKHIHLPSGGDLQ